MDSLFRCPNCGKPLRRLEGCYRCDNRHSFDIASAGYTNLLVANQKNSKSPGDDKAMVAARTAFLDAGYYAPLLRALCSLALAHAPRQGCTLLDCGCGEGYYTAGVARALTDAGIPTRTAGIDISKFALKKAAKRLPNGEFGVASAYHLPVEDNSVDLLLNIFSPLAAEEFSRVLRPGGCFIYAVPSALHLWEMKQVLYDRPYENQVRREDYPGFVWVGVEEVRETVRLKSGDHIMALFGMTPYAWKTPKRGVERLRALDTLETQIGFDFHVYQKKTH